MKSHITADFRKAYRKLPREVRHQAQKNYRLFRENPAHPSLRFKSIHPSKPYYSVRASLGYRAVGIRDGEVMIWFWIGSHTDYDRLIARL